MGGRAVGKRVFDPPLAYAEIDRVYSFMTHVLRALGMPQWRLQVMTKPCRRTSYADITPGEMKHVGELRLAPAWMTMDVEAERIPTLVHECLHLTHAELTHLWSDEMCGKYLGTRGVIELGPLWERAIEMWVDQQTQVMLALLPWEDWAEEVWGPEAAAQGLESWRDLGSTQDHG